MDLTGTLIAESPIYRGNAVKTLFTRDGDGRQKLVSLPGQIDGTAKILMDAFIGRSKNGRNQGQLNRNWQRLYGQPMPQGLISRVECRLDKNSYLPGKFFDLRMGIKLNEDRWAMEGRENYKMETVFRNAIFNFNLTVTENVLDQDDNRAKLFYLLQEMKEGRFWFGAGKTKGLGNLRLELDLSGIEPQNVPALTRGVNHLRLDVSFDSMNPVLVGWNWGRKDPNQSDDSVTDAWVDGEIETRQNHIQIKNMILSGIIKEREWNDEGHPPSGIERNTWKAFLDDHKDKYGNLLEFRHMRNTRNLNKSITNDKNFISFLTSYREKTKQELHRDHHIDFRAGGESKREISRKYGKPYDKIFMRMLKWKPADQQENEWEIYIPGGTIKGAFRKRAAQVLNTLMPGNANRLLDSLFGKQGQRGKILFSDAYLTDPVDHEKAWCSMDGVQMNPQTGRPCDKSKLDYLFAYGEQLKFKFKLDIQDITDRDLEALSILFHLLSDVQRGDIPFGGERNNGFGWIKAEIPTLTWLTSAQDNITGRLFPNRPLTPHGIWQEISLSGPDVEDAIRPLQPIPAQNNPVAPPSVQGQYISHRSFGGHCGMLTVEAEVLTPLNIRESGAPSYTTQTAEGTINGWDFFSMSPPDQAHRSQDRIYALPSRSIKGMLRHIYAIASDSRVQSTDITRLNPVDSLFGWVGKGDNQALAGRLSFSFGPFKEPKLSWFKAPYPYGAWQYTGTEWLNVKNGNATKTLIDNHWRVFPHASLAPTIKELDEFKPEGPDAVYFRAIMPRSKAQFTIRFWNLLGEELQRLIWCIMLEPGLAHKMGNRRYLGFGSVRLKIGRNSFFTDWTRRYSGGDEKEWQRKLRVEIDPNVIKHYEDLKKELNGKRI